MEPKPPGETADSTGSIPTIGYSLKGQTSSNGSSNYYGNAAAAVSPFALPSLSSAYPPTIMNYHPPSMNYHYQSAGPPTGPPPGPPTGPPPGPPPGPPTGPPPGPPPKGYSMTYYPQRQEKQYYPPSSYLTPVVAPPPPDDNNKKSIDSFLKKLTSPDDSMLDSTTKKNRGALLITPQINRAPPPPSPPPSPPVIPLMQGISPRKRHFSDSSYSDDDDSAGKEGRSSRDKGTRTRRVREKGRGGQSRDRYSPLPPLPSNRIFSNKNFSNRNFSDVSDASFEETDEKETRPVRATVDRRRKKESNFSPEPEPPCLRDVKTTAEKITLDLGDDDDEGPVELDAKLKTVFVDRSSREKVRERDKKKERERRASKERSAPKRGGDGDAAEKKSSSSRRSNSIPTGPYLGSLPEVRKKRSRSTSMRENLEEAEAEYSKAKSVYKFAVSIWKEQADKYELHDSNNPLYITMKDAYRKMKVAKMNVDEWKKKLKESEREKKNRRGRRGNSRNGVDVDSDASGASASPRSSSQSSSRSDSPEKPRLQKYWSKSRGGYVFPTLSRSPSRSPSPTAAATKNGSGGPDKTLLDKAMSQLNQGPGNMTASYPPAQVSVPHYPPPNAYGMAPYGPPPIMSYPPHMMGPPPGFGIIPPPGPASFSVPPPASFSVPPPAAFSVPPPSMVVPTSSAYGQLSRASVSMPPVGVPPPTVVSTAAAVVKPALTFQRGANLLSVTSPSTPITAAITPSNASGVAAGGKPPPSIQSKIPAAAATQSKVTIQSAKNEESEKKLRIVRETIQRQTRFLAARVYTSRVKTAIAKNTQLSELGIEKNEVYFLYFKPHFSNNRASSSLFMMSEEERLEKMSESLWNDARVSVAREFTTELVVEPDKESSNPFATWSHFQVRVESGDDYAHSFQIANVFPIQWYDLSSVLVHWPQIFKTEAEEYAWVDGLKSFFTEMSCVGVHVQLSEFAKKIRLAPSDHPLVSVERLPFEVCLLVTFVFPEAVDILINLRLEFRAVPLGFRRLRASREQYRACIARGLPLRVDLVQRESKVLENPPDFEQIEGPGMLTREFLGLPKVAEATQAANNIFVSTNDSADGGGLTAARDERSLRLAALSSITASASSTSSNPHRGPRLYGDQPLPSTSTTSSTKKAPSLGMKRKNDEDEDDYRVDEKALESSIVSYLIASSADKNSLDAEEVKKYFGNFGPVAWCVESGTNDTAVAFAFDDVNTCKTVLQYGHRIKKRPIWLQGMGEDGKTVGKPTVARDVNE